MFLNDPRENSYGPCMPESGVTCWLESDNRHEARYQWGAMIVDYCDLPPEEYAQTIFNTGGSEPSSKKYTIVFKNADGTVLQSTKVEEGSTIEYTGATPTKESTDQYDYTFSAWTPELKSGDVASSNKTYTATFSEVERVYDVKVLYLNDEGVGEDGKAVEAEMTLPNISYSDITFENIRDNVGKSGLTLPYANYTWTGGSFTCNTEQEGVANYTASYKIQVYEYLTKFLMDDGTTLIASASTEYRKTVNIPEATKDSTVASGFTFSAWTPELSGTTLIVTESKDYTATFDSYIRKYDVSFQDENGNRYDNRGGETEYGSMPNSGDTAPVKYVEPGKEKEYVYNFTGWTPEIHTVDGPGNTYTAQFEEEILMYKISISAKTADEDGIDAKDDIFLYEEELPYSSVTRELIIKILSDKGEIKFNTKKAEYITTGMSIVADKDSLTFHVNVSYKSTENLYNYTFLNYDGSTFVEISGLTYGSELKISEVPTKVADYAYKFTDWTASGDSQYYDMESGLTVDGNLKENIYTPEFEEQTLTLVFLKRNEFGIANVVDTVDNVLYSQVNSYPSPEIAIEDCPMYVDTSGYTCVAVDDGNGFAVFGNASFPTVLGVHQAHRYNRYNLGYALAFTYDDGVAGHTYQVTGGTLSKPTETPIVVTPGSSINISLLMKNNAIFNGWSDGNASSSRTFKMIKNIAVSATTKVLVEFKNDDDTLLQSGYTVTGNEPKYVGAEPTKEATSACTYEFSAWTPDITVVTNGVKQTYTAQYIEKPKTGNVRVYLNNVVSVAEYNGSAYTSTFGFSGKTGDVVTIKATKAVDGCEVNSGRTFDITIGEGLKEVKFYPLTLTGDEGISGFTLDGGYDYINKKYAVLEGNSVHIESKLYDKYEFNNWSDGETAATRDVIVNPSGMTLTAFTKKKQGVVNVDFNGVVDSVKYDTATQTESFSITGNVGDNIILNNIQAKTGYRMVSSEKSVTITEEEQTITFYSVEINGDEHINYISLFGGMPYSSEEKPVIIGETNVKLGATTETGYSVNEWKEGENFLGSGATIYVDVTENMVITVDSKPNSYKITLTGDDGVSKFYVNGEEYDSSKVYEYSTNVELSADLNEGKEIDKWKKLSMSETFSSNTITITIGTDNRYSLTTKDKAPTTHTLTYHKYDTGGTETETGTTELAPGASIAEALNMPEVEGYHVVISTDEAGTSEITEMPDENTVVYAKYFENTPTVDYLYYGGMTDKEIKNFNG